jgi:hypothetical protein
MFRKLLVSTKKTISGIMLGFYILYSKIRVEVYQPTVKFEGRSVRPGKVEVEVIDIKSKRLVIRGQ